MLIKVGNASIVNASEVDTIYISEKKVKKLVKAAPWYSLKPSEYKEETEYTIELSYVDNSNNKRCFLLACPSHTLDQVRKIKDDILAQVKELEIERLSTQLESAIRKS